VYEELDGKAFAHGDAAAPGAVDEMQVFLGNLKKVRSHGTRLALVSLCAAPRAVKTDVQARVTVRTGHGGRDAVHRRPRRPARQLVHPVARASSLLSCSLPSLPPSPSPFLSSLPTRTDAVPTHRAQYAPDPDPSLTQEDYERSHFQNEELGLNDINVDDYGHVEVPEGDEAAAAAASAATPAEEEKKGEEAAAQEEVKA